MPQQLVPHEIAVRLREAGFDDITSSFYQVSKESMHLWRHMNYRHNACDGEYAAPTLDEAANWLRERGLHIYTMVNTFHMKWRYHITSLDGKLEETYGIYDDHPTALLSAIDKALTILKERV